MLRYTGARVRRVEDGRLVRGRGRFVDDVCLPRTLHAAFVRSPHAHARLRAVEPGAALGLPGVVAVLRAGDLRELGPLAPRLDGDGFVPTEWAALVDDRARFAGEAAALVLADSPYTAADGRDAVVVDWEPLAAVATVDGAAEAGAVLVRRTWRHGDVAQAFAGAAVTLRETFEHGRCAPSPIEPRGLVADWDGDTLTVWASTQTPHMLRAALAAALRLGESRVRVIVPDVGGGFGLKMHVFPEDLAVAAAARRVGRPVKWIERRSECLQAASQAREQRVELALAAGADGRLLAVRARVLSDAGAYHVYPLTQALEPLGTAGILPGPYLLGAYEYEAVALATNKPPVGAYRGVGMTMGALVMERALDLLAARLALDPAEIRRRNLIPRDAYPYRSASGQTYDSGDFRKALEQALGAAGYEDARRAQATAPAGACSVGIGIGCYTEYTGMGSATYRKRGMREVAGPEAAVVTIDPDGGVRCAVSVPSQGQGHATSVAQMVADRLGVDLDHVRVGPVDTVGAPVGTGTFASRGAVALAGAIDGATETLRKKLAVLAAHLLEASPADIELDRGRAFVRGVPDRAVALVELARHAYAPPPGGLPEGIEPGLEARAAFDPPGPTFSGAVHVAVVEVDGETGQVAVRRYVVVEDCGPVINPLIVEGQVHGAVGQGIGEALLEALVYDAEGQLLTGTLMDYALPRATDVPAIEVAHLETPSPLTPGGVKGMGEGGTIGAPAAIANAVADALRHRGTSIRRVPIRAEDLWR